MRSIRKYGVIQTLIGRLIVSVGIGIMAYVAAKHYYDPYAVTYLIVK